MKRLYSLCYRGKQVASITLMLVFWLASPNLAQSAPEQKCTQELVFYKDHNYKIREVRVESVFDFLKAISSDLKSLKSEFVLQKGGDFTVSGLNQGREKIENHLEEIEKYIDPQRRIKVILGKVDNCDDTVGNEQLDVVYRIFTTNYNSYLSHTWEIKNKDVKEPSEAAAETIVTNKKQSFLRVNPFVSYNRTRRLYGGIQLVLTTPSKIFNTFKINSSSSQTGNVEGAELAGSQTPQKRALNYFDYSVAYKHSDLTAGNNRLREGHFRLQFNAATRTIGDKGIVLRYGAALEGGNQQSNLVNEAISQKSLANSGYGALKTYIGTTWTSEDYSFTGSYGLQLGNNGASTKVEFAKHLVDVAFTKRWVPDRQTPGEVHKILTIETRLAAGAIQNFGGIPVSERFFGGNVPQNFISNDSWEILSNPLIRSISQNRLNSDSTIGAIGGTKFLSFNLTVAKPVWGYPLLKKEIAEDPEFHNALDFSVNSTRQFITDYYVTKLNLYAALVDEVYADNSSGRGTLKSDLKGMTEILNSLPTELPDDTPQELRDRYEEQKDLLDGKTALLVLLVSNKKDLSPQLLGILTDGDIEGCRNDPEECSQVTRIIRYSNEFRKVLKDTIFAATAAKLQRLEQSLDERRKTLIEKIKNTDIGKARLLAGRDMKDVTTVINSVTKEVNLVAVSPIGIFDVARLSPDKYGTRFGVGGGIRLALVNFNITLGYAFNPKPAQNEGRGAIVFSLDVINLFH